MVVSILYYILTVSFLIVWAVVISVAWLLTVWWDRKKRVVSALTYVHAMMLFWLAPGWRIRVEGISNFDRKKPYVIICNHQGMFDIPLLYAIRPNVRWVAKRELLKMPFVGHAMLVHGDILIERGNAVSARQMFVKGKRQLDMGVSVAVFPEGTRLKSGKMNRFKEGAFTMAKMAGVGILPVVMDGTSDAFRGWKLARPHTFRVHVLPAIPAETVRGMELRELTELARETVLAEHIKMRPDLYDGKE